MGIAIKIGGLTIPGSHGAKSGSSYWTPSSAVVENAAPTDVVLTYAKSVNPADVIAGNFTVAGKTISGAVLDGTGKILTLTVTVAFVYGDSITVVANGTGIAVTNNITAEAELTTYITGLSTELSGEREIYLNNLILDVKSALGISNLSNGCDYIRVIAGETEESSYKNIVKDAHHATNVSAMAWVKDEGVTGDGVADYLNSDYKPKSQASAVSVNNFTLFVYVRTNQVLPQTEIGSRKGASDDRTFVNTRNPPATIDTAYFYINTDEALGGKVDNIADSRGLTMASRTAGNLTTLYKNGYSIGTITHASSDLPDYEIFEGAMNSAGSGINFSTNQIAITGVIRGVNATEALALTDAFERYMSSIKKALIGDVGWNWCMDQMVVYNASVNKTWIGVTSLHDQLNYIQHIITYDNTTGEKTYTKVGTVYEYDDHNQCSILVRADNKLLIAYAEHGSGSGAGDGSLRFKISTNALDATGWGNEITFAGDSDATYPSLYEASDGTIFCFYRERTAGWCYVKSADGGATWNNRVHITQGIDVGNYTAYIIPTQSPVDKDFIYFIMSSGHPYYATNISILAFYFDCSDEKFYKLDGTETTANLPFDALSDLTLIETFTSPNSGWVDNVVVDATGKPRFLYTAMPNGKNDTYNTKDLYYTEWDGSALTTPHKIHTALVGRMDGGLFDPNATYQPCAFFNRSNPDLIVAGKEVDGITEIHKITRNASNDFTTVQKTFNSNFNQWRPVFAMNHVSQAVWLNQKYYGHHLDNFAQTLVIGDID